MYNNGDLNALKGIRDIEKYIDALSVLKDRFLITLSVKDTPGHRVPEEAFKKIRELGFTNLTKKFQYTYIGVINRGGIVYDKCGGTKGEELLFESGIENFLVSVKSSATNKGVSEIKINGIDYSMNYRGWNIVVYDHDNERIVDSVTYDSWAEYPEFYHKNFYFDDEFFDSRFFISDKYKKLWTEPFTKSCYSNRTLKVQEIENGIFLPLKGSYKALKGGVCDENFNFICGHDIFRKKKGRYIWGSYKVSSEELDYIDETVVYGGSMLDHPGHLIAEYFANRIWWYVQNPDSKLKIAVQAFDGDGSAKFIKEFLRCFGFTDEQIIFVEKPTKFKNIIVPEQSALALEWSNPSYEYTQEFISVFKHMAKDIKPSEYKKIYFTKSLNIRGNIIGEKYFADFYADKGFTIIDPADYTLKEKISFMLGCDEFVTSIGTSALYAVFCKPSVKLTLLSRINTNGYSHVCSICEAAGIKDIYCVDVSLNFLHKNFVYGISLMGVTDSFKKYVKAVYGEEHPITTEESIKNNLWEYLSYFPEYYSSTDKIWGRSNQFNSIKNQKMLTVLQMISEVFLGKEFDTTGLDLTTVEDELQLKCKISTANMEFLKSLFRDVLFDNKLFGYLRDNNCVSVSLVCTDPDVTLILQDILRLFCIKLNYLSSNVALTDIPDKEWKKCVESNIILYYDPRNRNAGSRDGINAINVHDIINGTGQTNTAPLFNTQTLIAIDGQKELWKQNADVLKEQYDKIEEVLEALKRAEKENKQENAELKEALKELRLENENANKEASEAFKKFKLENEKTSNESLKAIKELKLEKEKAYKEIVALKSKVNYYENSRSWRITKPLRSISRVFKRIFGKKNQKG